MIFLNLVKESFLFALHALRVNRLRTFLSLLGITIGIFAIILVFTLVDGMERDVTTSIQSLGDNVIYVQKWPWTFGENYPWWKYMSRPLPTYDEMESLKDRVENFKAIALGASTGGQLIKYKNKTIEDGSMFMVSHDYDKIRAFDLQQGRYFTQIESDGGRNVCLIGYSIKQNLFENYEAVGKEISVKGRKLTVVGVFNKEGKSMLDNGFDELILVPINYGRKVIDINSDRVDPFIMAKGNDGYTNEQLKEELRGAMRSIRRLRPVQEDDFALNESKLIANNITGIFDILQIVGWIIGGLSILVGGFGIANILFVSVKERTNLIGIQKSLGAKNFFILLQFLFEAVLLCLIGGIIGIFLVYLLSLALEGAVPFPLSLTVSNIVLGLTVSANIGIIAGFLPAYTASQLDPVEAIRS